MSQDLRLDNARCDETNDERMLDFVHMYQHMAKLMIGVQC